MRSKRRNTPSASECHGPSGWRLVEFTVALGGKRRPVPRPWWPAGGVAGLALEQMALPDPLHLNLQAEFRLGWVSSEPNPAHPAPIAPRLARPVLPTRR
jgi:hypothetical protein